MNKAPDYSQLLQRYLRKECTPQEALQLFDHLEGGASTRMLLSSMQADFQQIMQEEKQPVVTVVHRVHFLKTAWFRYAAAIIAILGITSYLWLSNRNQPSLTASNDKKAISTGITPGGQKATLTLADGSIVVLDNSAAENLTQKNNNILKIDANQLAYKNLQGQAGLNTVSTPKGTQYQVILADGSKVWLNAMSSIKFPTSFTGTTRTVEISGEAYMEIAQNAKQPFMVKANGTKVQVLGTSFNINAYSDEKSIKTTLVEGSVKVSTASASELLKPGQQANVEGASIKLKMADINQTLAWKNGLFNFEGASLREVMNQLQRWYDVEIVYENGTSDLTFFGEMGKDVELSVVLKGLKGLGLNFRLEGRKLIVMP